MYGPTAVTYAEFFTLVTFLYNFKERVIYNKSMINTVNSIFINYSQSFFG
jgi:hypothetical protein